MLSKNIPHLRAVKTSAWRKISLGTWRISGDSSVYGMLEVNAGPALAYLEKLNQKAASKLTLTHFTAKVLARAFRETPQINSIVRWGKLYQRQQVDIFVHVAMDDKGEDLSGVVIRELDEKPLLKVAEELNARVRDLREKGDPDFAKIKNVIKFVPSFVLRHVLDLTGFILYSLNLWSPALNVARDPFGSAMVTNIGSLGAEFAFTPIPYYSRVPFILSIGAVKDGAWVKPGTKELSVVPLVKFGVTFDHRIIDGVHAAKMNQVFKKYFEYPEQLEQ